MARTIRDSKIPKENFLVPIDVSKFGTEDDPCFAVLYSLSADECQICGDAELCSVVFANRANTKRIEYEKKNPVLDMEIDALEKEKDIKDYLSNLRDKGYKGLLVRKRLKQRFRISDEKIKTYIS